MFKKLFSVFWIRLLVPLVIASFLVNMYEPWVLFVLLYIKAVLKDFMYLIMLMFPWKAIGQAVAFIFLVLFFSVLPPVLLNMYAKHKTYNDFPYIKLIILLLWLFYTILLLTNLIAFFPIGIDATM